MFQVKCPECSTKIQSPLLIEQSVVICPKCEKNVEVSGVTVATKKYKIQREDLKKKLPYYKGLLETVERDLQTQGKGAATHTSSEAFRSDLKELLLGARDSFRVSIPFDHYVEVAYQDKKRLAKLINLSMTGAAIELVDRGESPPCDAEVMLVLLLPEHTETLAVRADIVWNDVYAADDDARRITLGLMFRGMDDSSRNGIGEFIVKNSPADYSSH